MRDISPLHVLMNAKTSSGAGNAFFCKQYQNIEFYVKARDTVSFTIKFAIAYEDTAPDFTLAQATKEYDYVAVRDRQDNAVIAGDTGVAFTLPDYQHFNVETNSAVYFCPILTTYVNGTVTVKALGSSPAER